MKSLPKQVHNVLCDNEDLAEIPAGRGKVLTGPLLLRLQKTEQETGNFELEGNFPVP